METTKDLTRGDGTTQTTNNQTAERRYTKQELADKANQSFQKGKEHALNDADQQAKIKELEQLREKDKLRTEQDIYNKTFEKFTKKFRQELGISGNGAKFLKEHANILKGLDENELKSKIKELKKDKDNEIYFNDEIVNTKKDFIPVGSGDDAKEVSFIPGTTIPFSK